MSNKINTCCKCGCQPELNHYISTEKDKVLVCAICPECKRTIFGVGSIDPNFSMTFQELDDEVIAKWNNTYGSN